MTTRQNHFLLYKHDMIKNVVYSTPFLICCLNIVAGIFNVVWYPGEVASPLIIAGGSSAIYYLFIALSYEERKLSLFSFIFNNITVFLVLQLPDPCCFLVVLFLIMVASFHLFLFFSADLLFDCFFLAVLLSRIFYHFKMSSWGFGLVTELMFLRLEFLLFKYSLKKEERSEKRYRIEPLFYLVPFFLISFCNLVYLDSSLNELVIHISFIFAAAALIFFTFFANKKQELISSFLLYNMGNFAIGYLLSISLMTFFQISSVFLVSNIMFTFVYIIKAKNINKTLWEVLVANNREGIQALLMIYFLILGVLLAQLNPEFAENNLYSKWILGLGIQIGFLTARHFFFPK